MVDDTTTLCKREHRYSSDFESLPDDQGGAGRHKCAGCAYERGFLDGLARKEQLDLGLEFLPDSQAGTVAHKSPHAAYSKGYLDGVRESYKGEPGV